MILIIKNEKECNLIYKYFNVPNHIINPWYDNDDFLRILVVNNYVVEYCCNTDCKSCNGKQRLGEVCNMYNKEYITFNKYLRVKKLKRILE